MENAVDALHLAAAVLIFVVALSISINAFGEVRMTSQTILNSKDKEYNYTYVEDNGTTERIVGLESIVPSIYKAYKENYKIVFRDDEASEKASDLLGDDGIYRVKDSATGNLVGIYKIDLQEQVLGSNTQKEQFIMAILYGSRYADFTTVKDNFQQNLGIYLNNQGIYDKIKNRGAGLKENLGIYYQEEVPTGDENAGVGDPNISDSTVPDANKTTKRVITYTKI